MKKADNAVRTIGEVSLELNLKPHILRYWEEQFPTLKPMKRSGGRRYYRPDDIALIRRIDALLNKEGYTIKGAKKVLSGKKAEKIKKTAKAEGQDGDTVQTMDQMDAGVQKELEAIRNILQSALA